MQRKQTLISLFAFLFLALSLGCSAPTHPDSLPNPLTQSGSSAPFESTTAQPLPEDIDASATADPATELVTQMSLREKVASVIMGHIPGTNLIELEEFLIETGISGFIFMGNNVPATMSQMTELTQTLKGNPSFPRLMAIDQEGGVVSRLSWDSYDGAWSLKHEDPTATANAFHERAKLLRELGINLNFGIVADYTADQTSYIYDRVLGVTPHDAASRVHAAVQAEQGVVASTLKHFPGHGATPNDSHWGLPKVAGGFEAWVEGEAIPFKAGIDAGAESVMFGHLIYSEIDALPASLSSRWHDILRNELMFEGVSVTDDMSMLLDSGVHEYDDPQSNALLALQAGNDLLLFVAHADAATVIGIIDFLVASIETGALSEERLTEAALRVTKMRLDLAAG